MDKHIDIDKPRYDQSTYTGRLKHFLMTTNPANLFKSSAELAEAKTIVQNYRADQKELLQQKGLTEDDLWKAKQLYDSAYHPDTGEKMILIGRMSCQVPGNMLITGGLLSFYKSAPAVIFWQWFNQTYNAVVNYTNRSGSEPVSVTRLATSYVLATTGAVSTALFVNKQVQKFPPLVGRFVPFVAVAAANCINIPCMRSAELSEGTPVVDEDGQQLGSSTVVGRRAITQVVFSRILMAVPAFITPPIIMNMLEKRGVLRRFPWIGAPLQSILAGVMFGAATPACCALFPQMSSIPVAKLEPELQETIRKRYGLNPVPSLVYYNKGL